MRSLALTLKLVAIVFWLGTAWVFLPLEISDLRATTRPTHRDTPQDWGTPAYRTRAYIGIGQTIVLLCLSLLPNRLLVRSPWTFALALVIASFPVGFVVFNSYGRGALMFAVGLSLLFYAPLPLSLVASYWNGRVGGRITNA